MSSLSQLFPDTGLTPHGFCLSWNPDLVALHVSSDALIALSYFSIPAALIVFLLRRRDLAFRGAFWLFAAFILACGSTHVLSIWTIWHPDYETEGVIKAVTAVVSVLTAIQLWPLIPKAVALPSPEMLRLANAELEARVAERDRLLRALEQETADRLRSELLLARAQKLDAVGQLTGGIAHDFNNMLTVVIANLELLARRAAADPNLLKYVERANRSASRGANLVQQLLAFARRLPLQPVSFDPARLIEGAAPLLRDMLGERIRLHFDTGAGLPQVEADPHQLETALFNLAINARDAMPEGGTLTVRAAKVAVHDIEGEADEIVPGEYVVISVIDTGSGMSKEVRESAFEPFFTTKPVGQGSGLGLSQVYGFIKQSHGHVALQSVEGQGTTVSLYLRALPEAKLRPSEAPVQRGQPRLRDGGPEAFAFG